IYYAERRARDPERMRELERLKGIRRRGKSAEKLRAYGRAQYSKNRDRIRAHRAERYAQNIAGMRDKTLLYQKLRYETGCIETRLSAQFNAAKCRAKKRGIPFDLKL